MSNRLIAFLIAVALAILSSYAQENVLAPMQVNSTRITQTQDNAPILIKEEVFTNELTPPTPPVMEEAPVVVEIEQPIQEAVPVAIENNSAPTLPATPEVMPINIGLSTDVRQKSATILNKLLSDEYVLYTKTLKYHWNVQGIVFHDFHALFKEQYEKLFEFADLIAERARALGAPALGNLQDFLTYTRLKEINGAGLSPLQMIADLLTDHETIIRTLRENIDTTAQIGDQGTSNFLQDLIVKHEKIAWMLRASLK